MSGKTVAYVGSYTYIGKSKGITVYDVDTETDTFTKRCEVEVNNSSYLIVSRDKKHLYSIADEGIVTFDIEPDGNLTHPTTCGIRGMRGCYLALDQKNRYLFVAGSHDGKVTVLRIGEDGRPKSITDGVFHEGMGSVAEKGFKPHVTCVCLTPDEKYLCAVDAGIDQIKVYSFNKRNGSIRLKSIIRCEMDSGPRHMLFSKDGRFAYVMSELQNEVTVYGYDGSGEMPEFLLLQQVSTLGKHDSLATAASSMYMSEDENYLFCTNAGDNSVCMYDRSSRTGHLKQRFVLPISGQYPKDVGLFPDGKMLYSVNHDGDSITFFLVDYEKGVIVMKRRPVRVDEPNRCVIVQLPEE